jgi:hypothetical protein
MPNRNQYYGVLDKFDQFSVLLFPPQNIYSRKISPIKQLILLSLFIFLFSLIGGMIPANGFIGFDWTHFFEEAKLPPFYPPWAELIIAPLTWPLLVGITLGSVTFASLLRARHPLSSAVTLLTLPVLWTVFLGQIDGLLVLGLLWLPWLTPLVLLKPQVTIFAFLAKRSYIIGLAIVLLSSFLIWGFWPGKMFSVWQVHEEGRYVNDIALGLWGLPIAVILLWFSRGDIDMLMTAGTFTTPYLLPYNLIPIVPAIARLNPRDAIIAVLFSWLPFSANWIGEGGWFLGWAFIAWIWYRLAIQRYPSISARNIYFRLTGEYFSPSVNN